MSLMLDANVNRMKEVCHYSYMVMWIKLSRHVIILTWLCWFVQGGISLMLTHYAWSVDNFQSLLLPLSHPDSFPPVLPHLRLVQGHPHHLIKIASACALCFASNQFLSNLWFSVRSSATWSNSSTAKASTLPDGAYSWAAALVMFWSNLKTKRGT